MFYRFLVDRLTNFRELNRFSIYQLYSFRCRQTVLCSYRMNYRNYSRNLKQRKKKKLSLRLNSILIDSEINEKFRISQNEYKKLTSSKIYIRGHIIPVADVSAIFSEKILSDYESFKKIRELINNTSNIVPIRRDFETEYWTDCERRIREMILPLTGELEVTTGFLEYEKIELETDSRKDRKKQQIYIPSIAFKIITAVKGSRTSLSTLMLYNIKKSQSIYIGPVDEDSLKDRLSSYKLCRK